MSRLRGLYPATVCPFTADLKIDRAALESYLAGVADTRGVSGLVVNGHIGEVLSLTTDERAEVVRTAKSVVSAGQPVFAGISGVTADELVREGVSAREAGADGVLVLPPLDVRSYRRLSGHLPSVMHFIEAVDHEVDSPMIIHQYPEFTGAAYSMQVLRELATMSNVVAFKVATLSVTQYARIWDEFSAKTSVLTASDGPPLLAMLLHGADGALIGIAAVLPRIWADLLRLVEDRRFGEAADLFREGCMPLMAALFDNQEATRLTSEAAAVKHALVELGQIIRGDVRPPAVGVDAEVSDQIERALRAADRSRIVV